MSGGVSKLGLYGAVELGGTKILCAVGERPETLDVTRFTTRSPMENLADITAFFTPHCSDLHAIGVGSFGPLSLDPDARNFGSITSTPKPGWRNTDVYGALRSVFDGPINIDTDVAAALIAESRLGAAQHCRHALYLTIGTGIGAGILVNGRILRGAMHPEVGHMMLAKHPEDTFAGICPYHANRCFEGLCSGPALAARWGVAAESLPATHPAWQMQADYVAQALVTLCTVVSPERIVLGGGVAQQPQLFPLLREAFVRQMNGYLDVPAYGEHIEACIVPAELGQRAGIVGAFLMAQQGT